MKSQKEHHLYDVNYESLGNPEHIFEYEWAAMYCKDKIVLDFGCNTGLGTTILLKSGAKKVIGVDVSKDAIEFAKEKFNNDNRVSFELVKEDELNFTEDTFDVIVALNIIEHLSNPEKHLQQMYNILKDEGILLISTVNRHFRLWPWEKPWNEFHYREYSIKSLEKELKRYFDKIDIQGHVDTEGPYYPYSYLSVFKRKFKLGVYYPILNFLRRYIRPIMVFIKIKKPLTPNAANMLQGHQDIKIKKNNVDYTQYKKRILISDKNVSRFPKFLAIAYKLKKNR